MSLLETTLTRNTVLLELSREARRLRVVRVQLDDGRRLIGIRYPLPLISEVASTLKAIKKAQLTEVHSDLLVLELHCELHNAIPST